MSLCLHFSVLTIVCVVLCFSVLTIVCVVLCFSVLTIVCVALFVFECVCDCERTVSVAVCAGQGPVSPVSVSAVSV